MRHGRSESRIVRTLARGRFVEPGSPGAHFPFSGSEKARRIRGANPVSIIAAGKHRSDSFRHKRRWRAQHDGEGCSRNGLFRSGNKEQDYAHSQRV